MSIEELKSIPENSGAILYLWDRPFYFLWLLDDHRIDLQVPDSGRVLCLPRTYFKQITRIHLN